MKTLFASLIVFNCILLFSCSFLKHGIDPIVAEDISSTYKNYKLIPEDQILIYAAPRFAPHQYKVMARMKSKTGYESTDLLMSAFRKRASELHANSIIVLGVSPPTNGFPLVEGDEAISLGYILTTSPIEPATGSEGKPNSTPTTKSNEPQSWTLGVEYNPNRNSYKYKYSLDGAYTPVPNGESGIQKVVDASGKKLFFGLALAIQTDK